MAAPELTMAARKTLLGLVVAGVLFAFIWFVERRRPTTESSRESAKWALDLPPAEITRVESGSAAGRWVLEKQKGRWRLVEPVSADVDEAVVSGVLLDLGRIESHGELPAPVDRKALGLEPPGRTVRILTAKGPRTVRVGLPLAGIEAVAAELDGGAPFAARRTLATAASRGLDDLREKRVLARLAEADRIEGRTPSGDTWWIEKRNGEWWCGAPSVPDDLVEAEALGKMSDALRAFRASFFGGPARALPGWWEVRFRIPGEGVRILRVDPGTGLSAAPNGRTRVELDGEGFEGPTDLPTLLPVSPRSRSLVGKIPIDPVRLVATRPTGKSPTAVSRVEWTKREDGTWSTGAEGTPSSAPDAVIEFVRIANGERLFSSAEMVGLAKSVPEATLEITDRKAVVHRVDVFSAGAGGAIWYRRRPAALAIGARQADAIRREVAPLFAPPARP